MKTTIVYALLVSICFIGFSSCDSDKASKENSKVGDQVNLDENYILEPEIAVPALAAYQTYIDAAQADLTNSDSLYYTAQNVSERLTYGVKVELSELNRVELSQLILDADEFYLLNALRPNNEVLGDTVTEIIFAIKPSKEKQKNTAIPEWVYFDFTSPCPAACPTITGVNYPTN